MVREVTLTVQSVLHRAHLPSPSPPPAATQGPPQDPQSSAGPPAGPPGVQQTPARGLATHGSTVMGSEAGSILN